jgi:hypothetical protein
MAPSSAASSASKLYDALAALLCLVAALTALTAVQGLAWPCESDLYRDMGAAQSLLDGRLGEDPAFLGERWWYPPLVPMLVGTASALSGVELHRAYTTFGLVLNLLAPAGFYVLMARLLGRGAGLASLTAFLFFAQHDLMSWLHATYSPWLWACNLAQGFFYFALYALVAAFDGAKPWLAVVAGVLAGLTFLAHAAPGLLLGAALLALFVRELVALRRDRVALLRTLRTAALVAALALLVASPFLLDIFVHYGGKVRNPAPLTWLAGELSLAAAGSLAERLLSVRGVLALAGLLGLFWPGVVARRARWALAAWFVFASLGLAYGYASQRTKLPPLMPSWHFYFYLQAFESAAFGVGALFVSGLVARAGAYLARRGALSKLPARLKLPDTARVLDLAVVVLLVLVVVRWDRYAERPDLKVNRDAALGNAKAPEAELYAWALRHAKPSDVFLAETSPSHWLSAAGRKVVWLSDIFSNPYVKLRPRASDAPNMLAYLRDGRYAEFSKLAARHQVRFVVLHSDLRSQLSAAQPKVLKRRHKAKRKPGFDVYAVVEPAAP